MECSQTSDPQQDAKMNLKSLTSYKEVLWEIRLIYYCSSLCCSLSTFLSHIWMQCFSFVHEQSCVGSVWPGLRSELHPPAPPSALSHRQILLSYIWKITTFTISLKCTLIRYMNNSCRYICRYSHIFTLANRSVNHRISCERKLTHGYLKWLTHKQNLSSSHTHISVLICSHSRLFAESDDRITETQWNTVWMIQPIVFVGPHTHWHSVTSDSDMCGPFWRQWPTRWAHMENH